MNTNKEKMKLPSKRQLQQAQRKSPWSFGNGLLYNLCKKNFKHNTNEEVIAKALFIGRIYAAAIERRKNKKNEINDDFYIKKIPAAFKKAKLDFRLQKLKRLKSKTQGSIRSILETHYQLTLELQKITALEKRSFSSKYLHFHLPELFYIYDSRSVKGLRQFVSRVPKDLAAVLHSKKIDKEYAKFYCKCAYLKGKINDETGVRLSSRELDNLLIGVANRLQLKKKIKQ